MLSTPSTLAAVADELLAIARRAGEEVEAIRASGELAVEEKGPNDPVTRADRAANRVMVEALSTAFEGVPIVAEESPSEMYESYGVAPRAFFVDPIDGTRELIAGNGEYALMIGLAEGGEAALGVVLWPARGLAFVGVRDLGAWQIDGAGRRTALSLSESSDLAQARVVVSRSRSGGAMAERLAKLGARERVLAGSVGVKAAILTLGEADLYAHLTDHPMKLWDLCAPEALVRAAGGVFTDARGVPFDYGYGMLAQGKGVLAGNAALHAAALAALGVPPRAESP